MRGSIRRSAAAATMVLAAVSAAAAANPLGRDDDPVVVTGSAVPSLLGAPPGRIVAFRWESGWVPIPVQVDERKVADLGTILHRDPAGQTILTYADAGTFTGPDDDPSLDADDEIAFLAADAGAARAGAAPAPAHALASGAVEVAITDPVGGGKAYVYLFQSDGSLDPGAGIPPRVAYVFGLLSGDYKTTYDTTQGPNPEASSVTTGSYRVGFSDRWIRDVTAVTRAGATGVDILDRHKDLFGPGQCTRSENTFSDGAGAFIVNKTGPVRGLRGYVGANSGRTTWRLHRFYPGREEIVTALRVHAIGGILDYFDYAPAAAGMTYRNANVPAGVPIDGVQDPVPSTGTPWEMVTGAQGTLAIVHRLDTDIPGFTFTTYYSDRVTPIVTQCTGDAFEYGASGPWHDGPIPNTDPSFVPFNRFVVSRAITYGGPNLPVTFAQAADTRESQPLAAVAASWTPQGGPATCPDPDADGHATCDGTCTLPANAVCGDNCPSIANPSQADADRDGLGDACDPCPADPGPDPDADGVCSSADNCPTVANPTQADSDGDGVGNACDPCPNGPGPDADGDGVCDVADNCPAIANAAQSDGDGDGIGDACDPCPRDPGPDPDRDGVCSSVDNCPLTANPSQSDADGDGLGDACDPCPGGPGADIDGDGVCDGADNCPNTANPAQGDADHDGLGDACDPCPVDAGADPDGDGACTSVDNCPNAANPGQADFDGDGRGDACESGARAADIDLSGRVDGIDLARLGVAFGAASGGPRYDAAADLDRNGVIDGADLALLAASFGAPAP